jgi:branched-chain amino acid transport system ATP-binding protein
VLDVKNLSVGYGLMAVVNDLTLSVEAQTVVGLIGANGAGKTTTVNAIAGVLPIVKGQVRFEGQRVDRLRPDEICKRGISLVPQSRELFPLMTVYENLEIAGIAKHGTARVRDRVDKVLEHFPKLQDRMRQRASSLSGGEQQMLVIARALMAEPKLLLLDEPTTGLAPLIIDYLHDVIAKLVRSGQTILLVEQNTALVMALAHKINVMRKGSIVFSGTREELNSGNRLAEFYLR